MEKAKGIQKSLKSLRLATTFEKFNALLSAEAIDGQDISEENESGSQKGDKDGAASILRRSEVRGLPLKSGQLGPVAAMSNLKAVRRGNFFFGNQARICGTRREIIGGGCGTTILQGRKGS